MKIKNLLPITFDNPWTTQQCRKLPFLVILVMLSVSCSDIRFGDAGLSRPPESSGANLDTLFSSMENAHKVLTTAYSYLPYGLPVSGNNKLGGNVLESISDLQYSTNNTMNDGPRRLYYNGALSRNNGDMAGNEAYRFGSESEYSAVRYAWIFIENAHKIPNISSEEKNMRIAEAKAIIGIAYFEILRHCGGFPILDHSIDVNETLKFPRNTFAQCVDFIVKMLDESAAHLPWTWDENNNGRMTKAGSLALKLRLLCFVASPTFNGKPYHPQANEYHCYGGYEASRWTRAKAAADEFMAEYRKRGYYALVMPKSEQHEDYRLAYRQGYYDRGTTESVISIRKGFGASTHSSFIGNRIYSGPTLNWVNMYSWADGSAFPDNFNWQSPEKQPFFEADGTPTRDPRLYENVAVPGDIYYDGKVAPLHINHPNYREGGTGFSPMKFILNQNGDRDGKPVHWPYMRYAEVLLNMAEAINEANNGPTDEAYAYVNMVRGRVGLPSLPTDLNKESFRAALLHERALEFGYEEIRWFDLVRWGLEEEFRKPLKGLTSKGDDIYEPKTFQFSVHDMAERYWVSRWDTKWYLAPIPNTEVDMEYGMTQNPGW